MNHRSVVSQADILNSRSILSKKYVLLTVELFFRYEMLTVAVHDSFEHKDELRGKQFPELPGLGVLQTSWRESVRHPHGGGIVRGLGRITGLPGSRGSDTCVQGMDNNLNVCGFVRRWVAKRSNWMGYYQQRTSNDGKVVFSVISVCPQGGIPIVCVVSWANVGGGGWE